MKKAKSRSIFHHAGAALGVRTRARTMKLSSPSDLRAIRDGPTVEKGGDGCYLQLRSRRLERLVVPLAKKPRKLKISAKKDEKDESSFGENEVDFVTRERIARETTPNGLIMGSNIIKTPMSSNKATTTFKNMQSVVPTMPNAQEVEEFLADAEKKQIEKFIEDYNFDPVNEKPLEGRYEWKELKP